jgi:hypothetical protein
MFTVILILGNILLVVESQEVGSKKPVQPVTESFLTYRDTIYGIGISYPSSWQIIEPTLELMLAVLENMSNPDSQTFNLEPKNEITSRAAEVLEQFGLKKVSELLGLSPDEKSEFFKRMSQAMKEEQVQLIVGIVSPPENESDTISENMNIVVENISTLSPISLKEYVNANIEGLKISASLFDMVEPVKEIKVDGNPAISFVYTESSSEEQGKAMQVYTIRDQRAYIFTFGASVDTFSAYLPTYLKMLESVEINS